VAQGSPPRRSTRPPVHGHRAGDLGAPGHGGLRARPARPDRHRGTDQDRRWEHDPAFDDDTGDDPPPWAGLITGPSGPGRRQLRSPQPEPADEPWPPPRRRGRSRAAAARLRRSRRRVLFLGGGAVAVLLIAIAVIWLVSRPGPAPHSNYVTTLQPGEFRAVPDACRAVSAATLTQDLAGVTRPKMTRTSPGPLQSQCAFTADTRPVFRVVQVSVQAFQPSLLAPGNGSATANATASYFQDEQQLANPPKKSRQPRAAISPVTGLGQAAFSAVRVLRSGKNTTYLVTVEARDRNTVVTVLLEGLDQTGQYGPVSRGQLQAGALATAREVVARAAAEPTA
jgi:hypothetical protein